MQVISENAMESWKQALRIIRNSGRSFIDENNNECYEILNCIITVDDSETALLPLLEMRSQNKWHYPSAEELRRIMLSPKKGYAYTYGSRIVSYSNGMNQLDDFIVPLLTKTPYSRRAVINLWDPSIDENLEKRDVPGMISIDFKLRNGRLFITGLIRSADLFFGWPANLYQLLTVQKYVCEKLQVKPGSITTFCTSAHVFSYEFEDMDEVFGSELNLK